MNTQRPFLIKILLSTALLLVGCAASKPPQSAQGSPATQAEKTNEHQATQRDAGSNELGEIAVQGIALNSTFEEVRKAVEACGPLPINVYAHFGYFDVRRDAYLIKIKRPFEFVLPACFPVGGERRKVTLTFAPASPSQQDAYKAMLESPEEPGLADKAKAEEKAEDQFIAAYRNDFADRRLIGVQVDLGSHTEAEMNEAFNALKSKYSFANGPTEAEIERFNRFSVESLSFNNGRAGTRYEYYPQFDSRELDYYFADFRVWLAVKHVTRGMEMEVVYVDSATAAEIKKRRAASTVKASDL